jgi:hypothetical protein
MSFIGGLDDWIVTYATLNDGRLRTFSRELRRTVETSCGESRSIPKTSPVWSACTRAVLSAIGRMITLASRGCLPQ